MHIRDAASRRLKRAGFCQKGAASQKVAKHSPSDISFVILFKDSKSYEKEVRVLRNHDYSK